MILKVGDRINVMKMARSDSHYGYDKVFKESGFFQDFQAIRYDDDGSSSIHAVYMLVDGSLSAVDIEMVVRVIQ